MPASSRPTPSPLHQAIAALADRRPLTEPQTTEVFGAVMRGEATPAQIAALLMGLRVKGETPEEVAGAARALRDAMVRVEANGLHLVDTCGTGGGAVSTFNISTAAAFVAAGAGAVVAKQAGDLDPRDVLKEICSLVEGPVSAEVVAVDADGMVREGKELAKIADNIVVKVPMLEAGMVAVRRLAEAGIKTNVTLCFSSVQCLIAAKAGAAYVSPFIGRLDDVGQEGMDVIREARVIFDNYQIATEILAASIRHPRHVVEAAMIGADVATLPPDVLKKLLLHPLTDRGLEQFLADWNKLAARAKAAV